MPTITFNAQFVSYFRDVEVELTEEEYQDLQSGKKKYYYFLNSDDSVEGEWTEGSFENWEEFWATDPSTTTKD